MSLNESLKVKALDANFRAVLENNPHNFSIPEKIADEIFEKACEGKPLFNGTLVCVKNFSPHQITGYTISFKEFLACYHLGYRDIHHPLAVSGWIRHRDKILFGVRSENVLFSPRRLELVPSGGVDECALENNVINLQYALINEFEQETGLLCDVIEKVTPEIIVYSKDQKIYDICQSITLKEDLDIYCDALNDEYSDLFWVPKNELKTFVNDNRKKLHPTSLAIIESKILS